MDGWMEAISRRSALSMLADGPGHESLQPHMENQHLVEQVKLRDLVSSRVHRRLQVPLCWILSSHKHDKVRPTFSTF